MRSAARQERERRPNPALIYRLVADESFEAVDDAVRKTAETYGLYLPGRGYSFTLVYPHKLRAAAERSPMASPPKPREVARELGALPLKTLKEQVHAEVIAVRPYPDRNGRSLGIYVAYPGLNGECEMINSTSKAKYA